MEIRLPEPVLNVLSSQAGFFARLLANALISSLVAAIAYFGFKMDGDDVLKLTGTLTTILGWFLSDWVAQQQARNVKKIQAAIQPLVPMVRTDGSARSVTVAAVEAVANLASAKQETPQDIPAP